MVEALLASSSSAATMPVWGAIALALVIAVIPQFGAWFLEGRKHKHSSESASSEEWNRNLRWAAELITSDTHNSSEAAIAMLDVLDDFPNLSTKQQAMIDSLLSLAIDPAPEPNYPYQAQEEGGDHEHD